MAILVPHFTVALSKMTPNSLWHLLWQFLELAPFLEQRVVPADDESPPALEIALLIISSPLARLQLLNAA